MKKTTVSAVAAMMILLLPKITYALEHKVEKGETLWSISTKYKVSVDTIKKINEMKDNTVKIGQVLKLDEEKERDVATVTGTYKVVAGDTMYSISKKVNMTVTQLASLNNISNNAIYVGQTLKVSGEGSVSATPTPTSTTYKVVAGDTMYSISKKVNVSVTQLASLNNISNNAIYVGQVLKTGGTATPAPTQPTPAVTSTYKVVAGDTLYSIATKFSMSATELKTLNGLTSNTLYVGQTLKVSGTVDNTTNETPSSNTDTQIYTVVAGDSLYKVATKFNKTIAELTALNNLKSQTLYVGQKLIIQGQGASERFDAQAIIESGKKYIGVPYVWGGTTPKGFDCSGFIQYVYGMHGISLPRTSQQMWAATTPTSQPKPGDLVFFSTYEPGPSHVGIYLGNNQMLQAGSSTGITISDMNMSYWKTRYLGTRSLNLN